MQQSAIAICVATSTLEIGIDIGNINLVVLAEPPFSIEALLQRIGRGNRRSGTVKVIAIAASTKEREHLESMFRLAINGEFNPEEYKPNLSVVIQQIFSYLYQFRSGITQENLFDLFNFFCSQDKIEKILKNLYQHEWIVYNNNKIYPSEELLTEGDKGKIHSNIPDQGTFKVIDIDSNSEVGMVSSEVDDVFLLAQRAWKVISIDNNIIKAKKFNGKVTSTSFKKHKNQGKYYYLLPFVNLF
jgi:ATP-dependent Lhr-like helicase